MARIKLICSDTTNCSSTTECSSTTPPTNSELSVEKVRKCSSTTKNIADICSSTTDGTGVVCSSTTSDKRSSTTESQRVNAWKKENQDTIRWGVAKGVKAKLKAEAAKRGMTLTEMLKIAVFEYLHQEE